MKRFTAGLLISFACIVCLGADAKILSPGSGHPWKDMNPGDYVKYKVIISVKKYRRAPSITEKIVEQIVLSNTGKKLKYAVRITEKGKEPVEVEFSENVTITPRWNQKQVLGKMIADSGVVVQKKLIPCEVWFAERKLNFDKFTSKIWLTAAIPFGFAKKIESAYRGEKQQITEIISTVETYRFGPGKPEE